MKIKDVSSSPCRCSVGPLFPSSPKLGVVTSLTWADERWVEVMCVTSEEKFSEPVSNSPPPSLSASTAGRAPDGGCCISLGGSVLVPQQTILVLSHPGPGPLLMVAQPSTSWLAQWERRGWRLREEEFCERPVYPKRDVTTYFFFGNLPQSNRNAHIWWVPAMAIHRMSSLWTSEPLWK